MDIQKFAIKYFLEKGQSVEPETWFRTFNSWIPDEKDEVWIDVADYSHVREGPVTKPIIASTMEMAIWGFFIPANDLWMERCQTVLRQHSKLSAPPAIGWKKT